MQETKGHVNKQTLGFIALIAGVALFSTVEVITKIIGTRVSPWTLVFLRFFITGLVLPALVGRELPRRIAALTRRDYGVLALNGFISITLALSLFHLALIVFEKASSCAVVFSANPIFVMLLARFINNEPFTRAKAIAVFCGAVGVAFFAGESGAFTMQAVKALTLITLAAIFFALGICISRRVIHRYGVFILMGFSSLFGSLLVLPLAAWSMMQPGAVAGLIDAWLPVLALVVPGTTVAYGLYYYGLSHCTAFQTSMPFFLKPVLASLLAVVWLGEKINLFMVIGSLCILTGLVITVVFSQKPSSSD